MSDGPTADTGAIDETRITVVLNWFEDVKKRMRQSESSVRPADPPGLKTRRRITAKT